MVGDATGGGTIARGREAGNLIEALGALSLPSELLAFDRRIHRFIYRCAKNRYLFDTLDHYHNLSLRILHGAMRRFPALSPELDKVVQEQILMLEAVCRGCRYR
ncbi:FCD domain-containing protein [Rhizobium leguminosarum]|uniref:FCD domain-containing protein n=1 Tax=Rhizobium leguminosarum TaxID=384 RepID=UPI0028F430B4|nr:FCD domain-containing protein [Rhizobium leguminosarum]